MTFFSQSRKAVIFLFSVLACLFLFACDSLRNEVDPARLNREPEKLVIVGFMSPQDTILTIQVSRSVPVLGAANAIKDISDATVMVSNGNRLVSLRYATNYNKQGINLYWASAREFPIEVGQTYSLTVDTPRGEKASAQCTIPVPSAMPALLLDSAITENGYLFSNGIRTPIYGKEYSVRAQWMDMGGQPNFYRVTGQFRSQIASPANSTIAQPFSVQNANFENTGLLTDSPSSDGSKLISRKGNYYRWSNNSYYNPILLTGPNGTTTITSPTGATIISNPTGTTTISPSTSSGSSSPPAGDPNLIQLGKLLRFAELTISLLHTDENYYRYHDAITRQQDTDGNPFAEPVLIPTNINGGLGCFGGYNRRTVVMRLK